MHIAVRILLAGAGAFIFNTLHAIYQAKVDPGSRQYILPNLWISYSPPWWDPSLHSDYRLLVGGW